MRAGGPEGIVLPKQVIQGFAQPSVQNLEPKGSQM
jgi:hypothetical protein